MKQKKSIINTRRSLMLTNQKLWNMAKVIVEKQKAATEQANDNVDWNMLEELWFDWLEEELFSDANDSHISKQTLNYVLSNFSIWVCYNRYGRTSIVDMNNTVNEFLKATYGENCNCECKPFKGKAVNDVWYNWHCTYCLKPILEKGR